MKILKLTIMIFCVSLLVCSCNKEVTERFDKPEDAFRNAFPSSNISIINGAEEGNIAFLFYEQNRQILVKCITRDAKGWIPPINEGESRSEVLNLVNPGLAGYSIEYYKKTNTIFITGFLGTNSSDVIKDNIGTEFRHVKVKNYSFWFANDIILKQDYTIYINDIEIKVRMI